MDTIVRQLMVEYCAEQKLNTLSESEQFEVFTTHCVLSEFAVEPFEAHRFRMGGSSDGGIDGYAVAVNDQLIQDPKELEGILENSANVEPTIVVLQAKTSAKTDRKIISDLRVRVENVLRFDEVSYNASDLRPLQECVRVLTNQAMKLSAKGVSLVVAYATTSPSVNSEMDHEAQSAEKYLTDLGIVANVEFRCLGRDELTRLYERSQCSERAKLTFAGHYVMPSESGVGQARSGLVSATDLLEALSDKTNKKLNKFLFSENIREFLPDAPVNDEIRATLHDDARRRRFAILNNGVTIVARRVKGTSNGKSLIMEDFQVVNGCQTCHVLAEEQQNLSDVSVKVQVFECDDDTIVNEIVRATNQQTEIQPVYFINREKLLKRLEIYYRYRRDQGFKLYFGRKPGKRSYGLRSGIISMTPQLRSYAAMFTNSTPYQRLNNLDRDFSKLFGDATEEGFYTAASALYRWDWLIEKGRRHKKYRPLGYQAIAVLAILHDARPLKRGKKDRARHLTQLDKVIWSDGSWERCSVSIQNILDKAIDELSVTDLTAAANSKTFGDAVVRHAEAEKSANIGSSPPR